MSEGFTAFGIKEKLRELLSDRYRMVFLAFIVTLALLLLWNLGYMYIQWDEAPHLNSALLLSQGKFSDFLFSSRYPPVQDMAIAASFQVFGASIYAARIVSVIFAVLSLWILFELVYRSFGAPIALVSGILFGLMPGFIWLSRLALIEVLLEFFFLAAMFWFISWLRTGKDSALVFGGLALGLGFLAKYQILAAGIVMLTCMLVLYRDRLKVESKARLRRFWLLVVVAVLVVLPYAVLVYQFYMSGVLEQWLSLLQSTDTRSTLYGLRFPLPVFYLIEMVWPYGTVHPISFFVYLLGLAGLGFLAWRRSFMDKILLVWFVVIYVFFTLVGVKDWRYVLPIFPVLAISASSLLFAVYSKLAGAWRSVSTDLRRKRLARIAAGCLIAFTATAAVFSGADAYTWVTRNQMYIPIKEATHYAADGLEENEAVLVACPLNLFSSAMVKFYLSGSEGKSNLVLQYPEDPVDAYEQEFDVSKLIALCEAYNVKRVLLFEYGWTYPYFNSAADKPQLNAQQVYEMLNQTGKFTVNSVGTFPLKVFIFTTN